MSAPSTPDARYASGHRWGILAAGTFAQAAYVALASGLAVLAPAIRARYGLGLTETGLVLASPIIGSLGTLYVWGIAVDRYGERVVLASGLGAAAVCVGGAGLISDFASLVVLFLLAGALGAGVNAATGRAVMLWFKPADRGFALGLRQSAVPISGMLAAVGLPAVVSGDDPRAGILTLAGVCAAGALVGLAVLREGAPPDQPVTLVAPLRNRSIWLLSGASALVIEPQTCLVGFLVVFLHSARGLSTAAAAAALAVLNLLAIGTRIGAGRWSDRVGSRLRPFRAIALGSTVLVACCAAAVSAPLELLLPLLVVMGCVAISWNGLSFAAVAETAGHARTGTALGIQQTVLGLSGAVMPIAFGAFVGGTSWRVGFAVSALFPLVGWRILRDLPG